MKDVTKKGLKITKELYSFQFIMMILAILIMFAYVFIGLIYNIMVVLEWL
ncbi:hypothetical protein BJV85_002937 [Clostridium acetobutylicum]|nr:hypothetical protein [Clostridium acetobutylicum]NOW15589.1 hypothetical protein [Clostridium acetobutylicum]NRY57268.1 hypothetical protein [Clostridium acetobutylicum]NSA94014.1 hypothetical protein [Clostridium acetobutylicum]NYC95151.1 hypothetical protein [Clostridium acetobutylicum]